MRELWSWEPLDQLRRLQRDMGRAITDAWHGLAARAFPAVNIWTGHDDAVVTVEVPGVDPQKLDLSVVGDTLTVSGSREPDHLEEGQAFSRRERETGEFSRTVQLPFRVETDKVAAHYAHGILRVTLPRLEADKPKQVTVKATQ
jgi:HSP20 family protein